MTQTSTASSRLSAGTMSESCVREVFCPLGGKIEGKSQKERESLGAGCHRGSVCTLSLISLSIYLPPEAGCICVAPNPDTARPEPGALAPQSPCGASFFQPAA